MEEDGVEGNKAREGGGTEPKIHCSSLHGCTPSADCITSKVKQSNKQQL